MFLLRRSLRRHWRNTFDPCNQIVTNNANHHILSPISVINTDFPAESDQGGHLFQVALNTTSVCFRSDLDVPKSLSPWLHLLDFEGVKMNPLGCVSSEIHQRFWQIKMTKIHVWSYRNSCSICFKCIIYRLKHHFESLVRFSYLKILIRFDWVRTFWNKLKITQDMFWRHINDIILVWSVRKRSDQDHACNKTEQYITEIGKGHRENIRTYEY